MRINSQLIKQSILPLMLGQLGLALAQGIQFLIVARTLGPHEFGKVAGILAITGALLPFSGLGSANTMVMHLARGSKEASLLYGNALFACLFTGALLTLSTTGITLAISDTQGLWLCTLVFCISELVVTKLVDISQHAFLGLEKHAIASRFLLVQSLFRLGGALVLTIMFQAPTALQWACVHLAAGAVAAVLVVAYTRRQTGHLWLGIRRLCDDIRTGVFFSLGLSARSVYMDIDKAVLAHQVSLSVNGAYTAAFRLVFMATTPLTAGLLAIQAKMYRAGAEDGLKKTTAIAKKAIVAGVAYGAFVGMALYLFAPLLPYVLGVKYTQSVTMLQALAFLPIPLFVQSALSDALAAANFQRARSFVQISVAGLSFVLNTVLISHLSWKGAVIATYSCQIALALMMAYMVASKLNQSPSKSIEPRP